jgi:beta-lactamase class A
MSRAHGDTETRLDRSVTALNEALHATRAAQRKRSSAIAFLCQCPATDELAGRQQDCRTRLRVGLPPDWRIGDKTGQSKRRTTSAFLGRSSVNQSW